MGDNGHSDPHVKTRMEGPERDQGDSAADQGRTLLFRPGSDPGLGSAFSCHVSVASFNLISSLASLCLW